MLAIIYYNKDLSEFSGIDFQTNYESKEDIEKMVESFNASPYTKRKAVIMYDEKKVKHLKNNVLNLIVKTEKGDTENA